MGNNNSRWIWFFAILVVLVIIGFVVNRNSDSSSDEKGDLYSLDTVKTDSSLETTSTDSLSSAVPRVLSFPPYPLLGSTPEEAYDDGYDDGYEQGERDGENGCNYEAGYDDENLYDGELATYYEMGYQDGYDEGYNEEHERFDDD